MEEIIGECLDRHLVDEQGMAQLLRPDAHRYGYPLGDSAGWIQSILHERREELDQMREHNAQLMAKLVGHPSSTADQLASIRVAIESIDRSPYTTIPHLATTDHKENQV